MRYTKNPTATARQQVKRTSSVLGPIALGLVLALAAVLALLTVPSRETSAAPPPAPPFPDQRASLAAAVRWMISTQQQEDGGYDDQFGSRTGETLDAIMAIASAGYSPDAVYFGKSKTPLDYLSEHSADVVAFAEDGGGFAGKIVLALTAANQDPRTFGGYDFIISVTTAYSATTGQYDTTPFNQSLAMLALKAVSETIPLTATQWLTSQQASDGSWDDGFGTLRNADTTAMAIMALVAAGVPTDDTSIMLATNFLSNTQLATGGWEYGTGYGENANSTALVVQALSALEEDFHSTGSRWTGGPKTPLSALSSWQNTTGAFQSDYGFGLSDDFYATRQAIPAVTGKPYPLPSRSEAARRGTGCLDSLQKADGSWDQFADTGFGAGEPAAGTARAIEAIAAYGEDPSSKRWTQGITHAVKALEQYTPDYLVGGRGGRVGTVMQGVMAAAYYSSALTVTNFAGYDLVLSMTNFLSPNGQYDSSVYGQPDAMLGLIAAGYQVAPTATSWLLSQQDAASGGWGFPDPDTTGGTLNALGRLGISSNRGVSYARSQQQADSGWGSFGPTNPNSTSEMVQGLLASGYNPFDPSWSQVINGRVVNPGDWIMAQQDDTNWCWKSPYAPQLDDPASTVDAVLLLAQQPSWPIYSFYVPAVYKDHTE